MIHPPTRPPANFHVDRLLHSSPEDPLGHLAQVEEVAVAEHEEYERRIEAANKRAIRSGWRRAGTFAAVVILGIVLLGCASKYLGM